MVSSHAIHRRAYPTVDRRIDPRKDRQNRPEPSDWVCVRCDSQRADHLAVIVDTSQGIRRPGDTREPSNPACRVRTTTDVGLDEAARSGHPSARLDTADPGERSNVFDLLRPMWRRYSRDLHLDGTWIHRKSRRLSLARLSE